MAVGARIPESMRLKRLQKQLARAPQPPPAAWEVVIPGLETIQNFEEDNHDYWTDPSYIDREIDQDAWEYLMWWREQKGTRQ